MQRLQLTKLEATIVLHTNEGLLQLAVSGAKPPAALDALPDYFAQKIRGTLESLALTAADDHGAELAALRATVVQFENREKERAAKLAAKKAKG